MEAIKGNNRLTALVDDANRALDAIDAGWVALSQALTGLRDEWVSAFGSESGWVDFAKEEIPRLRDKRRQWFDQQVIGLALSRELDAPLEITPRNIVPFRKLDEDVRKDALNELMTKVAVEFAAKERVTEIPTQREIESFVESLRVPPEKTRKNRFAIRRAVEAVDQITVSPDQYVAQVLEDDSTADYLREKLPGAIQFLMAVRKGLRDAG